MYQSGCEPDDTCARVVRAEQPHRVDLGEAAEQRRRTPKTMKKKPPALAA